MSRPKILIASGCPHCTTTQYRCVHLKEQLAALGYSATVQEWFEPGRKNIREILLYDLIVLHRVALDLELEQLIREARHLNKKVVFDVDDLVFEPSLTEWHRGVALLPEEQKGAYHDGVLRYLATLEASDYVITATPFLAELVQRRGKVVFVHRNALGSEMKDLSDQLIKARKEKPPNRRVIIGYGSGTPTHDLDFQEAVPALIHVMSRYPQVELWVVGPVQLPREFGIFGQRVRSFALRDWKGWFEIASRFDVNLAPLEMGNLFCRAKSEIKFAEAAALGIPTVASRLDSFEYAISQGENGFLAGDVVEWLEALEALVTDPVLREEVGQKARVRVEEGYFPEIRAQGLKPILEKILSGDHPGLVLSDLAPGGAPDVPLVINWIVPEPFKGSGGHTNIFRMIKYLVEFGHPCQIIILPHQTMHGFTANRMKEFVDQTFFPTGASFHLWTGEIPAADATIATHFSTVGYALNLLAAGKRYYFVQDFEPHFYPMGTEYVQAENTYHSGLHCITLGPWLARLMREKYQAMADHFDFAVDTHIYRPRYQESTPPLRVAFYARPATPRRGYSLGIEALRRVKERKPEVEVVLFGANQLEEAPPFPFTNRGILEEDELARLYSSCRVSLVLSLTNPSLVNFEMMACKCAVVDIQSDRVEGLFKHGEDSLLVDPTPEAMSEAILEILNDDRLHQHLVEQAYQKVTHLTWKNSARQIENILLSNAPPPGERIGIKEREGGPDLIWQIHKLLDRRERNEETYRRLENRFYDLVVEKAHLARENQLIKELFSPLVGTILRMARLKERVKDKIMEKGLIGFMSRIPLYLKRRWFKP